MRADRDLRRAYPPRRDDLWKFKRRRGLVLPRERRIALPHLGIEFIMAANVIGVIAVVAISGYLLARPTTHPTHAPAPTVAATPTPTPAATDDQPAVSSIGRREAGLLRQIAVSVASLLAFLRLFFFLIRPTRDENGTS